MKTKHVLILVGGILIFYGAAVLSFLDQPQKVKLDLTACCEQWGCDNCK